MAVDRYARVDRIGEGAYGVVFKAMDKLTNNIVALKRIRCDDEGVPATALREITLLKHLRSENVVELLNVVYQDNRVCMVLEYLDQDLKACACPPFPRRCAAHAANPAKQKVH